jgi:hypothetical protein
MTRPPVMTLIGHDPVLAAILAEEAALNRRFSFTTQVGPADIVLFSPYTPGQEAGIAGLPVAVLPAGAALPPEKAGLRVFQKPLRLAAFLDAALTAARMLRLYERREIAPGLFFTTATRSLGDRDGRNVVLGERETAFLIALLDAGEEGLTREQAQTNVWGYHREADSHAVETTVSRLRHKLREGLGLEKTVVSEDGAYRWRAG